MTKKIKQDIKDMKKFMKKVTSSKEEAYKFLTSTGIYTKSGNLTKHYK